MSPPPVKLANARETCRKEKTEMPQPNPTSEVDAQADSESRINAQKKVVAEVKAQWKLLWSERFDDRVKAEGVSIRNYDRLQVERGAIIHATRDFKPLNFKEILEQNKVEDAERFVQPEVHVGGWNKFIKTEITNHKPQKGRRAVAYVPEKREAQQPKKGGRGWLHST